MCVHHATQASAPLRRQAGAPASHAPRSRAPSLLPRPARPPRPSQAPLLLCGHLPARYSEVAWGPAPAPKALLAALCPRMLPGGVPVFARTVPDVEDDEGGGSEGGGGGGGDEGGGAGSGVACEASSSGGGAEGGGAHEAGGGGAHARVALTVPVASAWLQWEGAALQLGACRVVGAEAGAAQSAWAGGQGTQPGHPTTSSTPLTTAGISPSSTATPPTASSSAAPPGGAATLLQCEAAVGTGAQWHAAEQGAALAMLRVLQALAVGALRRAAAAAAPAASALHGLQGAGEVVCEGDAGLGTASAGRMAKVAYTIRAPPCGSDAARWEVVEEHAGLSFVVSGASSIALGAASMALLVGVTHCHAACCRCSCLWLHSFGGVPQVGSESMVHELDGPAVCRAGGRGRRA